METVYMSSGIDDVLASMGIGRKWAVVLTTDMEKAIRNYMPSNRQAQKNNIDDYIIGLPGDIPFGD